MEQTERQQQDKRIGIRSAIATIYLFFILAYWIANRLTAGSIYLGLLFDFAIRIGAAYLVNEVMLAKDRNPIIALFTLALPIPGLIAALLWKKK